MTRIQGNRIKILQYAIFLALEVFLLFTIYTMLAAGQVGIGISSLIVLTLGTIIYVHPKTYSYRYMFPGLLTFTLFVILPLLYTYLIGFTNYSSSNLLTFERAQSYFLQETYLSADTKLKSEVIKIAENQFRLKLTDDAAKKVYLSENLDLGPNQPKTIKATEIKGADPEIGQVLPLPELIKKVNAIKLLSVELSDNTKVKMVGLREFAPQLPLYRLNVDDSLTQLQTGDVLKPDHTSGFYRNAKGEKVPPGFRVMIGLSNYYRIFSDPAISGPFIKIFLWTLIFSAGSVFFTLSVGMLLAVMLEWPALRFKMVYRTLLMLPYAIPGFISILIFRGLFNANFGEINKIIGMVMNIKPEWFTDPFLAKTMILMVNTWLGFPYMMILCTGVLQSIPSSIYEASAIDGAGPVDNFLKITAPLIVRPLIPLLISSFAFNFNNFVLIYLLTKGRPDILNASTPAGETDILVSYTFRLAFEDTGAQYGFASAIATIIFLLVAILSILNLKLTADKPARI